MNRILGTIAARCNPLFPAYCLSKVSKKGGKTSQDPSGVMPVNIDAPFSVLNAPLLTLNPQMHSAILLAKREELKQKKRVNVCDV
jgi:hypothetical protein